MSAENIVWEDPVQTASTGNVAGVLHYFPQKGQTMFINEGTLQTGLMDAYKGQWDDPESAFDIDMDTSFTNLRFDHPAMGILYGAAVADNTLQLFTYIYAADISEWLLDAKISLQTERPIHSIDVDISEVDKDYFEGDNSLFSPGNMLFLDVTWGTGVEWKPMYTWFIDSIPYNKMLDSHNMQGRTVLGLWLKDVTFDDTNSFSGTTTKVVEDIILSKVTILRADDLIIESDSGSAEVEFKPSENVLTALVKWLEEIEWEILQLPDGRIIVGSKTFIMDYQPNTRYSFKKNEDVFTRKTVKNADAAYSRVCAYSGDFERKQYSNINTFPGWSLPQKTYYEQAPSGSHSDGDMTNSELSEYASTLAKKMDYVGITESVDGPMRPDLIPNDIAQIYDEELDADVTLGIVTEVSHKIGTSGYETSFSLDSGGESSDVGDYVQTNNKIINGVNRKRRITDFIRNEVNSASVVMSGSIGSSFLSHKNIIYVDKAGDDSNGGVNTNKPKLTFTSALLSAQSGDVVVCLSAGSYDENIVMPTGVNLFAPNTKFTTETGNVFVAADNSHITVGEIDVPASGIGVCKNDGTESAYFTCSKMAVNDGGIGVVNKSNTSELNIKCEEIVVKNLAIGIGNTSENQGYMSINIGDIYMDGAGCIGIAKTGSDTGTEIVGKVNNIQSTESASEASNIGFSLVSGEVNLELNTIESLYAISIQSGVADVRCSSVQGAVSIAEDSELNIFANKMSGTMTNNGALSGRIGNVSYGDLTIEGKVLSENEVGEDGSISGQIKIWDDTNKKWVNATLAAGSGIDIANNDGQITISLT